MRNAIPWLPTLLLGCPGPGDTGITEPPEPGIPIDEVAIRIDGGVSSNQVAVGDFNDDGVGDVLIGDGGAAVDDDHSLTGAAYLFPGPITGDLTTDDASVVIRGSADDFTFGDAVAGGGDLNGDGFMDLVAGESIDYPDAFFSVFHGPVEGEFWRPDADLELVASGLEQGMLAQLAITSLDADGPDDLIVTLPRWDYGRGIVCVAHSPLDGVLTIPDDLACATGLPGNQFGWNIDATSDLDGDGIADIVAGAISDSSSEYHAGAAYIIPGPLTESVVQEDLTSKLLGEYGADQAGWSVGAPGDVDGDGLDDVLVGALGEPRKSTEGGVAYLFLGPIDGTKMLADAHAILHGESREDYAGIAVAAAGDVDSDGVPDVVVGAYQEGSADTYGGAAYIVSGTVRGSVSLGSAGFKLSGHERWFLGEKVAGGADVDGDGVDDVLVVADGDGVSPGVSFLVSGADVVLP